MKKSLIILFAALVIFTGCYPIPEIEEEPFEPSAATLIEDVWTDGNFGAFDEEQWFKFTASAPSHTIHIIFSTGSLDKLNIQLHDSDGKTIGNRAEIQKYGSNKYLTYTSFSVEQEYYIKIERGGYYSTDSGKYKIAFSKSETPPVTIKLPSDAIPLTSETFADGNIQDGVEEQWFKFTATAVKQYIHVFGTRDLDIQLYKIDNGIYGIPFGEKTTISTPSYTPKYTSRTLNVGEEYYIKVSPNNSYYNTCTYKIAFSELFISPDFDIKPLTEGTWADGEIKTNDDVNWYKFTATDTSQYIHVSFGTMTGLFGLKIQLYDGNGAKVGNEGNLSESAFDSDKKYANRTLNKDQVYYINVFTNSNTGTYKIAFNTSTTPPTP
jgi:hypothetical protein